MKTERYYAVRIGSKAFHTPYLMLGADGKTPKLFTDEHEAVAASLADKHHKAVRVEIVIVPNRKAR